LLFDGENHASRAALAAHRMRARLRTIGRLNTGAGRVILRMWVGIHSDSFHFFLVGDPAVHRELIVNGPAAGRTAEIEALADAGEIGLSPQTAALLSPAVVGAAKGTGFLLAAEPQMSTSTSSRGRRRTGWTWPSSSPRRSGRTCSARPANRSTAGSPSPSCSSQAPTRCSPTRGPMLSPVRSMNAYGRCRRRQPAEVTFFESDINRDGGKVMLTAGAPLSADHDEERMLRAARFIVDRIERLPVRIGVNCGSVFAGGLRGTVPQDVLGEG
jgi:class 3 adenylate cyclase